MIREIIYGPFKKSMFLPLERNVLEALQGLHQPSSSGTTTTRMGTWLRSTSLCNSSFGKDS